MQHIQRRFKHAFSSDFTNLDLDGIVADHFATFHIVTKVLNTPVLRAQWEGELTAMRERIKAMRVALVSHLKAAGVDQDLSYITRQQGMFSYSGMSAAQMQRLRSEFGVYGVDSGRICVAALNDHNIAPVAKAIAQVVR